MRRYKKLVRAVLGMLAAAVARNDLFEKPGERSPSVPPDVKQSVG